MRGSSDNAIKLIFIMYHIQGRYARALLTIDNLEASAVQQLYNLLNAYSSSGSRVAIMPDGHTGKDCLVGFTQHFEHEEDVKLVPNFIGADISCGVFAWSNILRPRRMSLIICIRFTISKDNAQKKGNIK